MEMVKWKRCFVKKEQSKNPVPVFKISIDTVSTYI